LTTQLVSNGYTLSSAPNRLGWLTPSDPTAPIADLRDQLRTQGYLWLRGILPLAAVAQLRARYLRGYHAAQGRTGDERKFLMEFVRTAAYEAFCLLPEIWMFYEKLLDGAVYLHKRKIVRHFSPGDPNCTGAHYDLTYLRGGTDSVCSSWIPLNDCPVEMGGLVYLEGSDAFGRQTEAEYSRKNADLPPDERISAYNKNMTTGWLSKNLAELADKLDTRWLVADYAAGDMVIHTAYMIHAATTNQADEIRLSTDIRYQRIRDEIDVRWQNHWSLDDML
jgi:ectoine hydroxylase-related dioxygenase (phytanoyl-CoA dioxygenase family)